MVRAAVGAVILAAVLLTALLGTSLQGKDAAAASGGTPHPELDAADARMECQVCHADMTPDVVNEWYSGPHGRFNVKCFVCHGTLDDNFRSAPGDDFCRSCHDDQVKSMSKPLMAGNNCFSCHPPHLLVPHLNVVEYPGGRP